MFVPKHRTLTHWWSLYLTNRSSPGPSYPKHWDSLEFYLYDKDPTWSSLKIIRFITLYLHINWGWKSQLFPKKPMFTKGSHFSEWWSCTSSIWEKITSVLAQRTQDLNRKFCSESKPILKFISTCSFYSPASFNMSFNLLK